MPKRAFSGQHTSFLVKQRVFLSQTGVSKEGKVPSQTNAGPLRLIKSPPRARKGSLRQMECFVRQKDGLDRLIEGPCRPTECLPRSKKALSGQSRA